MEAERTSEAIERTSQFVRGVREEVSKVLVGQDPLIDRLLMGLICNGHILLEGVPGLGKSLAVSTLAAALDLQFRRLQFTPDLLPADLIGTLVFQPATGEFTVRKGPLFASLILADEVNRAPPKVQSALLEAMQERQVSIGDESFALPEPFLVLATQNPIEHEGTYRLPEAELDRFLLKVVVDYPDLEAEAEVLRRHGTTRAQLAVDKVAGAAEVSQARATLDSLYADERIHQYVLGIVAATRDPETCGLGALRTQIQYGASPRASLALLLVSKAHALFEGRDFVTPRDVKSVATDVLRHRLVLTFEAEAGLRTSEQILAEILDHVKVP